MRFTSMLVCLIVLAVAIPVSVTAQMDDHACEGVAFVGGYALLDESGEGAVSGILVNFGPEDATLT